MVDRVITNPDEGKPTEQESNLTDEASQAALKAAQDAGVVVNGEKLSPPEGDDQSTETSEVATRPDNVPEKFWNAEKGEINTEALLKSQQELERQFHSKDKAPDDKAPVDEGEDGPDQTTDAEAAIGNAEAEFAEAGELSDETYESLEKAGYSRAMVDRYIAGQVALAAAEEQKAFNATDGTRETYTAMTEWAAENLDRADIDAFNVQVANPETMEYAIQQMYQRYQNEADVEPALIGGETGSANNLGDYFKNSKEMTQAINSDAYKTDVNVQLEVQRKIQNAEKHGVRLFG